LNDEALVAYGRSNEVAEAIDLQTRAFGANPFDSEAAGNLAFLLLKQRPPDAETARRLAVHALTLNDARYPRGRTEDWSTLAIASALTGHDIDARNAWFVALALTSDLQRLCNAAASAETGHGDRLHPSVQALLQRVRSSAAYGRCEVTGTEPTRPAKAQGKAVPRPRRPIP
jgi:predicted Zn-dependent protease